MIQRTKKGRICFAIFFSIIMIAAISYTNDNTYLNRLSGFLNDYYVQLTEEVELPSVDFLSEEYLSGWSGNTQIVEFHGEPAVRVIENDIYEARALYVGDIDLFPVERIELTIHHQEQSVLPKIVLGFSDTRGRGYSYPISEKIFFDKWYEFSIPVSSIFERITADKPNFRLDDIKSFWISSISSEKDRIVFNLKDIYFFNKLINENQN